MTTQDDLDQLRYALYKAEQELADAVVAACPGAHHPVQHRGDGLPPWCDHCGRDSKGVRR